MKPDSELSRGAQCFVALLAVLGLIGGSLIVAHAGFSTSPRRGGPSVFVPAPQAYVLAVVMYGQAAVASLALLKHHRASARTVLGVAAGLVLVAVGRVKLLAPG